MWQRKCCAKENFRTNENSSLTSTILQNKVPPVFWLCQKSIEAYEVHHDIIMKTLLSFHSHFQKRLIIFSVSLVANFHFFLCQILFFQFSNFFFIDKTSSLSSKNIRDSTFKLVVNISQIP